MKIRRLYLLLIFIFSILITNLHYSGSKPPLIDKVTSRNLVILADHIEGGNENLIPPDMSDYDHSFVTNDNYKSFITVFMILTVAVSQLLKRANICYKIDRIRGLYGIVFWDKKRIMLN